MRSSDGEALSPLDDQTPLIDALVRTAFFTTAVLSRVAAEHDLSLTQLRVLAILRDRQGSMSDLATYLGLDKSTISGLVDRAENRGLLRRTQNPLDGRGDRRRPHRRRDRTRRARRRDGRSRTLTTDEDPERGRGPSPHRPARTDARGPLRIRRTLASQALRRTSLSGQARLSEAEILRRCSACTAASASSLGRTAATALPVR